MRSDTKKADPSSIDWRMLPVHPLAARFPMLDEDELAELAEDIRANGQREPIIIGDWKDGDQKVTGLIDGRNRRKACELAGVEPIIERLGDDDAIAYIVSLNIERRHLTAGQRAMLLAIAYPEPKRGMHSQLRGATGTDKSRLSRARLVLHGAPDWVDLVLAGAKSLDEGEAEARRRSSEASSEEARIARLRQYAPDVADLVAEKKISLAAGLEEIAQRERRRQETIDAARRALGQVTSFASHVLTLAAGREEGEALPISADQFDNVRKGFELLERLYVEQGDHR